MFSIGKNVSWISLGTGPFTLGMPPFTGSADSKGKPLSIHIKKPTKLNGFTKNNENSKKKTLDTHMLDIHPAITQSSTFFWKTVKL